MASLVDLMQKDLDPSTPGRQTYRDVSRTFTPTGSASVIPPPLIAQWQQQAMRDHPNGFRSREDEQNYYTRLAHRAGYAFKKHREINRLGEDVKAVEHPGRKWIALAAAGAVAAPFVAPAIAGAFGAGGAAGVGSGVTAGAGGIGAGTILPTAAGSAGTIGTLASASVPVVKASGAGGLFRAFLPQAVQAGTNIYGMIQQGRQQDRAADAELQASREQLAYLQEKDALERAQFERAEKLRRADYMAREGRMTPYRNIGEMATNTLRPLLRSPKPYGTTV